MKNLKVVKLTTKEIAGLEFNFNQDNQQIYLSYNGKKVFLSESQFRFSESENIEWEQLDLDIEVLQSQHEVIFFISDQYMFDFETFSGQWQLNLDAEKLVAETFKENIVSVEELHSLGLLSMEGFNETPLLVNEETGDTSYFNFEDTWLGRSNFLQNYDVEKAKKAKEILNNL